MLVKVDDILTLGRKSLKSKKKQLVNEECWLMKFLLLAEKA